MAPPKIIKMQGGSTLIYQRREMNEATSFVIYFKVGSQYDGDKLGICHFAEHMLLSDTKDLTLQQINEKHKKLSSDRNGATAYEWIRFNIYCANNKLEEALDLLCKQIFEPGLKQEQFENEKNIVLKEILKDEDNFSFLAFTKLREAALPNSFLIKPVLGTPESIKNITIDDIKTFTENHLTLENMVVVVTGNIPEYRTKNYVEKYIISRIKDRVFKPNKNDYNFQFASKSDLKVASKNISTAYVRFMFPMELGKGRKEDNILNPVLYTSNGVGGLLYEVLREERGLVYYASCDLINTKNYAAWTFEIESSPEKINDIFPAIAEVLIRMKMTEEKLNEWKDKEQISKDKGMPSSLENSSFRNYGNYNFYGDFVEPEEVDDILREFTVEEINQYIQKIREQKKVFISVFSNKKEEDIMPIKNIEKLFFECNTTKEIEEIVKQWKESFVPKTKTDFKIEKDNFN